MVSSLVPILQELIDYRKKSQREKLKIILHFHFIKNPIYKENTEKSYVYLDLFCWLIWDKFFLCCSSRNKWSRIYYIGWLKIWDYITPVFWVLGLYVWISIHWKQKQRNDKTLIVSSTQSVLPILMKPS